MRHLASMSQISDDLHMACLTSKMLWDSASYFKTNGVWSMKPIQYHCIEMII